MTLVSLSSLIAVSARGTLERNTSLQWRAKSAALLKNHFMILCQELRIGTLLEIGAHAAETSVEFVERTGGRAIAYEANPHTFESKTKLASEKGVDVRNLGISNELGTTRFHIPISGKLRSLTPGNASLRKRSVEVEYITRLVTLSTIDEEVKGVDLSSGVALWIDVEGMGYEALLGGIKLFSQGNCKIVMIEVECIEFWEDQATCLAIDNLMRRNGFIAVMRDAEYDLQYNVIYVDERLIGNLDAQITGYWGALCRIRVSRPLAASRVFIAWGRSTARATWTLFSKA